MDLYRISGTALLPLPQRKLALEREIQRLIEANAEEVFGIRLLVSEYPTHEESAGRLDSLGLDENDAPVVIEYKRTTGVNLVVQSLHYLHWVCTHKGDVEVLARERLGEDASVDWTQPRALCVADSFSPYDVSAALQIGSEVQLAEFRMFGPDLLLINVLGRDKEVRAGQAISPTQVSSYSVPTLLDRAKGDMRGIAEELREYALGLGDDVTEAPTREYVAFRRIRNFLCLEPHTEHLLLHLRLDPKTGEGCSICTDVSNIGHFGTGDLRVRVSGAEDVETAKQFIERAYLGPAVGTTT
jgi:predicted transport protein